MRDKGFGDTFERFTRATGIKWLIITITGWFGLNCGCRYRQELLNKWFPYKQKKEMNKKITLEDVLDPISPKVFFNKYWGKKHLVIRRNTFQKLYTWQDFSNNLNMYPDIKGLQIVNQNEEGDGRWCLDKVRKGTLKLPMLNKGAVYKLWNEGKSIVLPFAEYQKKDLVNICIEFEKYFHKGQANVYASPKAGSKSFPPHSDGTENFLFQQEGKQKWTIYKEFAPSKPKEILDEFVLEAGDLLYIPQYQYHKVDTLGPRLMISIHFTNKPKQSIKNFQISKPNVINRDPWVNWAPKPPKKKKFQPQRRMVSDTWKKKYFKDKI